MRLPIAKLILSTLIAFSISQGSYSQRRTPHQKWQKRIEKAEDKFNYGHYKVARNVVERAIKKANKGKKYTEEYFSSLALYAKYQEALGYLIDAEDTLHKAHFSIVDSLRADSSAKYINEEHYYIASAYYRQGDYVMASKHLSLIDRTQSVGMGYDIDMLRFQLDFARGFYTDATALLDSLIAYQRSITKRKVEVTIPAKYSKKDSTKIIKPEKTKRKRLKRKEYKLRQYNLAYLLALEAELERSKGNYLLADTLVRRNNDLITSLTWHKDIPNVIHLYTRALLEHDEDELGKAARQLKRVRKRLERSVKFDLPNSLYFAVFEDEIDINLEKENYSKSKKYSKRFKREAVYNFGRKSAHFTRAKALLIKDEISKSKYRKADRKLARILEDLEEDFPVNHPGRISILQEYYLVAVRLNDYEFSRELLHRANELARINYGPTAPAYHALKINEAQFEVNYPNNFFVADSLYKKHFDPFVRNELHPFHKDYVNYLNGYGKMLEFTDRFNEAYALFEESANIAKEKYSEASAVYGTELEKMAGIEIIQGNYLKAEGTLESATEAIRKDVGWNNIAYANTLFTLGELYSINGKFDEAQEVFKRAYRISKRKSENSNQTTNSTEELADVYINTGRYDDAEKILLKSIELKSTKYGDNHFQLIAPYSKLGELYLIKGDFIQAEKRTRKSLTLTELNLSDTALTYIDNQVLLADVYRAMGDYQQATGLYNEAIQNSRTKFNNDHIMVADIQVKLASSLIEDGQGSKGIMEILDNAERIIVLNINEKHPKYANCIELRALALAEEKNYEEAQTLLKKANAIYLETFGKGHLLTADNTFRVAKVSYLKGDYEDAISYYEDAQGAYKKIFSDEHPKYVEAQSAVGRSYYALKEYKSAMKIFDKSMASNLKFIEKYFPALSEGEKSKYWNSIKGDFELYNSLALNFGSAKSKLYTSVYNNKLATKAILLNSSVKVKQRINASGDEQLISRYDEWISKKEQLTKTLSMSEDDLKLANINVEKLEKSINILEKELSESSEAFSFNYEDEQFDWKDIRKTLQEGEAAIELVRFNYFDNVFTDSVIYAALIVTPETKKAPLFVPFANGNDLEGKYFKYYRNTIKYKAKDKYSYNKFWKPIDDALANQNISTIYLSADGIYNQLNPETLIDTDGKYLIDKYAFYSLSNTKDLALRAINGPRVYKSQTAQLFGNPKFGDAEGSETAAVSRGSNGNKVSSVEPLPGAEEEIKLLSSLLGDQSWKTDTYILDEATEDRIKAMESPRIFHVATHGFFMQEENVSSSSLQQQRTPNPLLKSGLLFVGAEELLEENNVYQFNKKDGVLTAYEAMNLKLDRTELVVLSACETGLGEIRSGEGVYGLQRAFIVAGAQNVIMTLFKVNDQVTQELMSTFYKTWLETGDKRSAFVNAKKHIKDKYDSPIYWGSFVMIGLD